MKVPRNAPCPCGSGHKYKRCCNAPGSPLVEHEDGSLAHAIPMNDEMRAVLKHQREEFVARFGREPGPDDPVFFDAPSDAEYDDAVTTAMAQAGLDSELIYAFRKTGRLVTDQNKYLVPAASREVWGAAIEEYHAMIREQKKDPQ